MLPEISQSTTRLGQRSCRARRSICAISPPRRSEACSVRRQSARTPRGSLLVRREVIGRTGSVSRAIIRRASAISAPDICSKSSVFSRSVAEAVNEASISISDSSARSCSGRRIAHRPVEQGLGRALLARPRAPLLLRARGSRAASSPSCAQDIAGRASRAGRPARRPRDVRAGARNRRAASSRNPCARKTPPPRPPGSRRSRLPGPIGSPARRRARAKWVMLWLSLPSSGISSAARSTMAWCPRTRAGGCLPPAPPEDIFGQKMQDARLSHPQPPARAGHSGGGSPRKARTR